MQRQTTFLILVTALLIGIVSRAESFRVATFETDITVPLGHALMGGGIAPAKEIVDPLRAQGIVLLGPDAPIVWVSLDWCEVRNDAYDAWRDALAEAAGTTRERVLLAAIHQHDTPVVDFTAQLLLDAVGLEKSLCDVEFVQECIARTAAALRAALPNAAPVTHYGAGKAKVQEVASNRRIVADDGTVSFGRNSSTPNPDIRNRPAGLIDPYIRTLSFWNENTPVAALSTYAVHPMSYYGRGGVSADFVGMARAKMQQELGDAAYLYFSGCSGDVVAGKYNDGSETNRPVLAERMYEGMLAAWKGTSRYPLNELKFRNAQLSLPPRNDGAFTVAAMETKLSDTSARTFDRNLAAMGLSWRARLDTDPTIDVPCVDFGNLQFLLMPAETFAGYQLAAQSMRPDSAVMVAGYGESAPGYIPTASATSDGFNDSHTWLWVDRDVEVEMKRAMRGALGSAELPALLSANGSVEIPTQEWPREPGPRTVKVHIRYPGGALENVNQKTGLMLSLHNWGGEGFDGAPDPKYLAERYNVIAIGVDYIQSGNELGHSGLPYDFGVYQAIDALRALHYVYEGLKGAGIAFAKGRIFSTGGSGGGNVSHMVNKFAPRTFACIVDISGMARLSDNIAYDVPGGSTLNARYSTDPNSPAYLSLDEQQIRFIGHRVHAQTMKVLGNRARIVVVHGTQDASCPVEDKRELTGNFAAAGLSVDAHFITKDDFDGKAITNAAHSLGNRTRIVSKYADPYLLPSGEHAVSLRSDNDFELRDSRVRYATPKGTYEISYEQGAPVLRFRNAILP